MVTGNCSKPFSNSRHGTVAELARCLQDTPAFLETVPEPLATELQELTAGRKNRFSLRMAKALQKRADTMFASGICLSLGKAQLTMGSFCGCNLLQHPQKVQERSYRIGSPDVDLHSEARDKEQNTVRYKEQTDGKPPAVGTLYVQIC